MNPEEEKMFFMCSAALVCLCPLKKIKAWVFYLIPRKTAGGGGGAPLSNFLSFQYSAK